MLTARLKPRGKAGSTFGIVQIMNGFWFSLGWCVFFFLPSLVFSVKLSKFFRRMEAPSSKRGTNVPNTSETSIADQWLRRNKVHHSDFDNNW